jgi:hypothetical protein
VGEEHQVTTRLVVADDSAGGGSVAGRKTSALWRIVGGLSAVLAGIAARKAIQLAWRTATGKQPPTNPESPDTTWQEAVGWAIVSGAAVGVARLLATRTAANYWRKSTGDLPPGLEEVVA